MTRRKRGIGAAGLVALDGERLEHLGARIRGEQLGVLEHAGVVRSSLGVGAGPRCGAGGLPRELHRPRRVTGLDGVVDEPRRIDVPAEQRVEDTAVKIGAPPARERLLDHAPCKLVPVPDDAALDGEQAALLAAGEAVRGAGQAHEPQLSCTRHDRDDLERRPRVLREPAHTTQHGVAHRGRRQLSAGGDSLGDEERVAAGGGVQLVGRRACQRRDRVP